MASLGDGSASTHGLVHPALIYGSDGEFMEVALPFVEEGSVRSESTLVAVQARNVDNLRSALGGEPEGVTLLSVEQWYETSALTRDKFARWARQRSNGGRVRLIGEPPWAVGNDAQVRDWARHESMINLAFEGMPVSFVCPYDARALPPEIVEYAQSTHPALAGSEGITQSAGYQDPVKFCRRLDAAASGPAGDPLAEVNFGLADLAKLRRLVTATAIDAGLEGDRAGELAVAVNEVATNAIVHGAPPATLGIWVREGEIVCEVSDAGAGVKDALAGQLPPPADGRGGRGLWVARRLCDAVEIRNGDGCSVSLHVTTRRPGARRRLAN
jgi:anti-sigma regulatory factor (Ser/Thr protein kinase)